MSTVQVLVVLAVAGPVVAALVTVAVMAGPDKAGRVLVYAEPVPHHGPDDGGLRLDDPGSAPIDGGSEIEVRVDALGSYCVPEDTVEPRLFDETTGALPVMLEWTPPEGWHLRSLRELPAPHDNGGRP